MAKKNWIKGAIKHPGALHAQLGVAVGKKIPAKKLQAAAKHGGKEGKRANLALTLKKLHPRKRKVVPVKSHADAKDFPTKRKVKDVGAHKAFVPNRLSDAMDQLMKNG